MTKQEMFDAAVRGLSSQAWQTSYVEGYGCAYLGDNGRRCAWGWVDPSLTDEEGGVARLRAMRIGIAATLNEDQLEFASLLQLCHDEQHMVPDAQQQMLDSFIAIGQNHDLIWPADVPKQI